MLRNKKYLNFLIFFHLNISILNSGNIKHFPKRLIDKKTNELTSFQLSVVCITIANNANKFGFMKDLENYVYNNSNTKNELFKIAQIIFDKHEKNDAIHYMFTKPYNVYILLNNKLTKSCLQNCLYRNNSINNFDWLGEWGWGVKINAKVLFYS